MTLMKNNPPPPRGPCPRCRLSLVEVSSYRGSGGGTAGVLLGHGRLIHRQPFLHRHRLGLLVFGGRGPVLGGSWSGFTCAACSYIKTNKSESQMCPLETGGQCFKLTVSCSRFLTSRIKCVKNTKKHTKTQNARCCIGVLNINAAFLFCSLPISDHNGFEFPTWL